MRPVIALCMLTVVVSALSPASEETAELKAAEKALKHAEDKRSGDLPALFLRGEDDLVDVLEDPKQSGREVPVEDLRQTLQDVLGKENNGKQEKKKKDWMESEVTDLTKALSAFKESGKKGSLDEILEDQAQEKKAGSSQSDLDKQAKAVLAKKKDHFESKHGSGDSSQIVKREMEIMKLLDEHIRRSEDMGEDQERQKTERYLLNILKQRLEEEPKNLKLMVSADPDGLYEKEEQFLQMLKDLKKDEHGRTWGDDGSGEEPFIPPALFKDLAKALGKLFSQSFLFFRGETKRENHPRDKREMHPWQLIEEAAGENDNLQEILGEEGLQMSARDQLATMSETQTDTRADDIEALQLAVQIREVLRKKSKDNMYPVEEIEENGSLSNVLSEVLHLARGLPDPSEVADQEEQLESQSTKEQEGENVEAVVEMTREENDGGSQALDILQGLNVVAQSDDNLRGLFDKISADFNNQAENMEEDKKMVQFVGHSIEEEDNKDITQDMEESVLSEEQENQESAVSDWADWFGNSLEVVKKTVSMLGTSEAKDGEIVKRDVSEVQEGDDSRDTIVAESLRVYQMYLKDQDETPEKREGVCKRTFHPCQRDADCCTGSCHRLVHKSQITPYCG
ncbi:centromere-associated protein E-like [Branchiostoma lanceolatum]|uniref:centromere-associated protein E-like n=1 Tax=Branchiostoma lanceolatum TaxID=7740 RepID=UPI003451AF9C